MAAEHTRLSVASHLATVTAAVAGVLAVMSLVLEVAGADAPRALWALWTGSLGSSFALISATLVRATPLILAALAVSVAFRAGIWNIGVEGQLLAGAAAATAAGLQLGNTPRLVALPMVMALGCLAGALWAGIAALLRQRFGVIEVISTIMLNFVALHLVGYLVRGPLQEPLHIYPQSPTLPSSVTLPRLVSGTRLHWGLPLAVASALAVWWTITRTAAGFRVRVVGANPNAARVAAKIDVARTSVLAFLASGALAGMAGAIEVTGVTFALYENLSPGYGYSGIAVALLARLHPLGVLWTGTLFGALESGGLAMQREAGVPAVVVAVVEAVLILVFLAVGQLGLLRGSRWPREGTHSAGTLDGRLA